MSSKPHFADVGVKSRFGVDFVYQDLRLRSGKVRLKSHRRLLTLNTGFVPGSSASVNTIRITFHSIILLPGARKHYTGNDRCSDPRVTTILLISFYI